MKHVPFLLLLLTATILGIATFAEAARGSAFIHREVYGALWFKLLWGLVALTSLWTMRHRQLWRRAAVCALHVGLLLVLAGGLTSALTHRGGMLHLRQGGVEDSFVDADQRVAHLPFALRLDTFYVRYYPGTEAPQDYVSEVAVVDAGHAGRHATISMNHILRHGGYRFYQSSFDPDGHGSWLTVTYDPYGTAVAYAGFLLFSLAAVCLLLGRGSEFRRLLRQFSAAALLVCCSLPAAAAPKSESIPVVARDSADELALRQVVWNDRVCPFSTLATDFTLKLSGKRRPYGYSPEQVVASWTRYPDVWNRAPLLKMKHAGLRRLLGIEGNYASVSQLFDAQGNYRLAALWQAEPDKQSKLAKAIQETDEKVALVLMLRNGTLVQPVPEGVPRLSAARVRAEVLYNHLQLVDILFMVNLTLGLLGVLQLLGRHLPVLWRIGKIHLWLSLLTLAAAYVLRWYVSGRIPLSNGFETMMFAALAVQALAIVLVRRVPLLLPFGFLLPGFVLLVAHLGQMNPQITQLMPVLNSPWLSSHVSIIMIAYALLLFTFVLGIVALAAREPLAARVTLLSRLLLYPAVLLLAVGIFLGAVWANVSWGTYWSWDPKEVWALITLIVYALPLHTGSLPLFRRPRAYHLYMLFAFATVLMTYFGVNYVLGGMHSYAN